jgi:alpha-ketoglutarate-dependent taurine dioxygenase
MTPFHTSPLGRFGTRVAGLQAQSLAAGSDGVATLNRLLDDHLVVAIADQEFDPNAFVAFAGLLGDLRPSRVPDPTLPEPARHHLFVSALSGPAAPSRPASADAAHVWHVDYTTQPTVPARSMQYARHMPTDGSRTGFADMRKVYEALPLTLKAHIEDLSAVHYAHPRGVDWQPEGERVQVPWEQRLQGKAHPLVGRRTDGRRYLFLPAHRDSPVAGLGEDESRDLLDTLYAYLEPHGAPWEFEQVSGDVLIWDNRAALHKRTAWPTNQRRLMWFLTLN